MVLEKGPVMTAALLVVTAALLDGGPVVTAALLEQVGPPL